MVAFGAFGGVQVELDQLGCLGAATRLSRQLQLTMVLAKSVNCRRLRARQGEVNRGSGQQSRQCGRP